MFYIELEVFARPTLLYYVDFGWCVHICLHISSLFANDDFPLDCCWKDLKAPVLFCCLLHMENNIKRIPEHFKLVVYVVVPKSWFACHRTFFVFFCFSLGFGKGASQETKGFAFP